VEQIPESEEMSKNHEEIVEKYSLKGKEAIKQTE
jgi:hypothetical protein